MLEQLAQYKILEKVGEGGMGDVYRARDTRLGRTVAIKVLPASVAGDSERREQFMRDARAVAAISHPNIAALYDVGEDHGHLFLAFEFVPGELLKAVIAGRPMNPSRAVALAVQIADALADAHVAGIIHRDIKPGNIVVTPKGHAKILDFGLARWTRGGAARERAVALAQAPPGEPRTGGGVDTVAYMSPEQVLGEAVDERTDLFSLGSVLFEMLTGKRPFTGLTPSAVTLQIVQAPAAAPSTIAKDVPREFDPIVAKLLAKAVDSRYRVAATLAAELRALEAILDLRSARLEEAAPVVGAASPRGTGGRWILIAGLIALAAAIAWYFG
jgi:eukaryotic-like serine/threonine-protein kinase